MVIVASPRRLEPFYLAQNFAFVSEADRPSLFWMGIFNEIRSSAKHYALKALAVLLMPGPACLHQGCLGVRSGTRAPMTPGDHLNTSIFRSVGALGDKSFTSFCAGRWAKLSPGGCQ